MPIGETIPTIAELKGNTILELFKNGYNALKTALFGKQNKLVAGDNIIIDETTNTISAVEGGSLDDYYTKEETDDLLDEKANAVNTYDKEEVDDLLADKADIADVYNKTEVDNLIDGVCEVIDAAIEQGDYSSIIITNELKKGDVVVCNIYNNASNVLNFVLTGIDDNQSYKNSSLTFNYVRTDANNYTKYFKQGSIYKYADNNYVVRVMDITETVTSGTSSLSVHSYSTISATTSKVTIYRKKEEVQ